MRPAVVLETEMLLEIPATMQVKNVPKLVLAFPAATDAGNAICLYSARRWVNTH